MQILYDGIQEQQRSRVNIIAGDFSESQVKMAQARIEKNQWIHHAKAEVIDMQVHNWNSHPCPLVSADDKHLIVFSLCRI